MQKVWRVLPYVIFAGLLAIIGICVANGGEKKMGLEIAEEDGLLEWGTCAAFAIAGLLGATAAVMKRKLLTKNQIIFLAVFSGVCLMAVGEELSWGQRILEFGPPTGMETTSDSAIKCGHNDVTWHNLHITVGPYNILGFTFKMSFSLGGMLFGVMLIIALAIHGILLPILYKQGKPKIVRLVNKLGMFFPPLDLGILVTAASLLFYIFRRTGDIKHMTEPNEYKEFFVPIVYAAIIAVTFFKEKTKANRIALEFFLILLVMGLAAAAMEM